MSIQEKTFQISGMSCGSCAGKIEKRLLMKDGVQNADVNFALASAHIRFEPQLISESELITTIRKLGYSVAEKNEKPATKPPGLLKLNLRLAISTLLTLPLLWSMASHFYFFTWLPLPDILINPWFQFALATPVQFFIAAPFYGGAFQSIKNKNPDMNLLIVMGTTSAYAYSVYQTITSSGHVVELYYETSAVLITVILLGRLLESRVKSRAAASLHHLLALKPETTIVEREGAEFEVEVSEIERGDILLVKPGERIPVDGTILEGRTTIDESMISGESLPVVKGPGDMVVSATINQRGSLRIRADQPENKSTLARMIHIVEHAQNSKPRIQRIADKVSAIFVPTVLIIAVVTFLIWNFLLAPYSFSSALEKSIAVLVIACPCALGLATPTSILVASGRAASLGILFKDAEHLESLQNTDILLFDKTGTLTLGKPQLTDLIAVDGKSGKLLTLVASVERMSEHPIATAVLNAAKSNQLSLVKAEQFLNEPGYGIQAMIKDHRVQIGNEKFLHRHDISIPEKFKVLLGKFEKQGKSVMLVAIGQHFAGLLTVTDRLRESTPGAIQRIEDLGIKPVMLTGDHRPTADAIAQQCGITNIVAEALPEDKVDVIKSYQEEKEIVAMVGDGINDAPALAVADIGISLGSGTKIAIESADVTLMQSDLNQLADAIEISRLTMKNIRQNLFWALAFNGLGIPFAAMGFLAPWVAGSAMAMSSVFVVTNALRLQHLSFKTNKNNATSLRRIVKK